MTGLLNSESVPDPGEADTAAEFLEALRQLKDWTGMGFRRLERRAAVAGHVLPRSTIAAALRRDTLPRADLVVAFVYACGFGRDEADRWAAAHRRIAAAPRPSTVPEFGWFVAVLAGTATACACGARRV